MEDENKNHDKAPQPSGGTGKDRGPLRILLTGATGFIGSYLLERLLQQGERVRVLALPETVKDLRHRDRVELVEGGLADEGILTEAARDVDLVYHIAALLPGSPHADLMKVNVHGTENLLRACGRAGGIRRFVFTSSVAVYGGAFSPQEWPMNEYTPPQPRGPETLRNYGRSKMAAESLVRRYSLELGFEYVILRPSTCYGVGSGAAEAMVRRAMTDPRAGTGPGAQVSMQLIHVRDLAEGIVISGQAPQAKNEIFNLSGIEVCTFRDVIQLIRRLGGQGDLQSLMPDQSQIWRRYLLIYEVAKAEQMLGFIPGTMMSEGFAEMVAAYEARGPIPDAAPLEMMPLY